VKVRILKKLAVVLPLLVLLWFCRKPTVASWDVDLVLPIVNSQLNIKNFLGDSIFKPDNNGLLNLSVTRTITAVKLDSLIELPDTTIVNSFTVPAVIPATLTPGQVLTGFPVGELIFDVGNGAALKKIDIRSGILKVKFVNDLSEPLDLIYKINSASKNGQTLIILETVPPNKDTLYKSYDLAGYSLSMTGTAGVTYNTIVQTSTVIVNPAANTTTVGYGMGVKAILSYSKITPDYVEGYFGKQTIDIPLDTTRLDFLKNFEASNFMLSSASFNFRILNEFGAEFTSNLSNIKAVNSKNGSIVALTTNQLSNININRATKTGTTVFPTVKTVSLNTSNSNITGFLSNLPDKLTYQGNVKLNPLGNLAGYGDFAFYGTGIKVLADINIPLKFNADYFKLQSLANIDFSNVAQLDNMNYGEFIISASNGYPFKAQIQAYLLDDQMQVVDSLFTPGLNYLERGQIDAQNVVYLPTRSELRVAIHKTRIEKLKKSKKVKLVTYLLLPPNPPDIKIYEHYSLDVNIVAELNYNVQRK
jgi:hypothetical protein